MNCTKFYLRKAKFILFTLFILLLMTNKTMSQNKYRPVEDAKGLSIGAHAPEFTAKNIFESSYSLIEALKKGPVVIVFIRGQWCPYCNKHLSHLQDSLPQIYDMGASVVVISPEKSEFIKKTIKKTGAEFNILFDEGNKISDAFDLTFKPDSKSLFMYNNILGAKLKVSHSDETERLPVPATFIINSDGKIVWRHFDPDYKNRSTIKDIVKNIPSQ
jgi:peroxiredoxin